MARTITRVNCQSPANCFFRTVLPSGLRCLASARHTLRSPAASASRESGRRKSQMIGGHGCGWHPQTVRVIGHFQPFTRLEREGGCAMKAEYAGWYFRVYVRVCRLSRNPPLEKAGAMGGWID